MEEETDCTVTESDYRKAVPQYGRTYGVRALAFAIGCPASTEAGNGGNRKRVWVFDAKMLRGCRL